MFQTKAAARQHFLGARGLRPQPEGLLASAQQALPDVHRIALYVSRGAEPQTGALIDWLLATHREVLLPILYADNDLGWGVAPGAADLVPGRLGLSEPPTDLGSEAIATAELVICPALAVARDGVRLGRGGGSYDRALARVRPGTPIWAAVYDSEIVDHLPCDEHDYPVDAALTPRHLVQLRRSVDD
ncbi:5-formyltetrahydrofolate cyclo-ligase [Kribbella sp. NPDC048915]|uniref:5-formyltetrahydrofolate cyclo-ligase n=1 Tax=Kribbella sp. NPDC048915 TaxID=3155148 RepID=UPI0033DB95D7